ncbi:MAG: hypothetical protein K0R66_497 [Gammaproteobacteria bacterium]|nr:hypothetical protein [Gammaproteobacteria bacterium]
MLGNNDYVSDSAGAASGSASSESHQLSTRASSSGHEQHVALAVSSVLPSSSAVRQSLPLEVSAGTSATGGAANFAPTLAVSNLAREDSPAGGAGSASEAASSTRATAGGSGSASSDAQRQTGQTAGLTGAATESIAIKELNIWILAEGNNRDFYNAAINRNSSYDDDIADFRPEGSKRIKYNLVGCGEFDIEIFRSDASNPSLSDDRRMLQKLDLVLLIPSFERPLDNAESITWLNTMIGRIKEITGSSIVIIPDYKTYVLNGSKQIKPYSTEAAETIRTGLENLSHSLKRHGERVRVFAQTVDVDNKASILKAIYHILQNIDVFRTASVGTSSSQIKPGLFHGLQVWATSFFPSKETNKSSVNPSPFTITITSEGKVVIDAGSTSLHKPFNPAHLIPKAHKIVVLSDSGLKGKFLEILHHGKRGIERSSPKSNTFFKKFYQISSGLIVNASVIDVPSPQKYYAKLSSIFFRETRAIIWLIDQDADICNTIRICQASLENREANAKVVVVFVKDAPSSGIKTPDEQKELESVFKKNGLGVTVYPWIVNVNDEAACNSILPYVSLEIEGLALQEATPMRSAISGGAGCSHASAAHP